MELNYRTTIKINGYDISRIPLNKKIKLGKITRKFRREDDLNRLQTKNKKPLPPDLSDDEFYSMIQ